MLDRVSTVVLGLDGLGSAERFADYSQWELWQRAQQPAAKNARTGAAAPTLSAASAVARAKKKLSFKEARELEGMEQRIAGAEKMLQEKHDLLLDPAVMSDGVKLRTVSLELESAQKATDGLYARWMELEQRQR
jgi:ATP-binding cassette subfamily F protein uup